MALKLTTTSEQAATGGVKILVYGTSGAGKTRLISSLVKFRPIIISAEAGLLSLREFDIPAITVSTIDEVSEAYNMLTGSEGKNFDCVCLDSISEIAETCLANQKAVNADPRQAYGEMAERMQSLVRAFRDLQGRHVYISAKIDRTKDEISGALLYGPSAPGQKLGPALPYLFDEVFALRVERNAETGDTERWLQTVADQQYVAKDRSGTLEAFELPDLGAIIKKIIKPPHRKG